MMRRQPLPPNRNNPALTMKKRILIIDDDIPLTHMVKFNLEATGTYEVHVENHAPNAVAAARRFSPDLIVLDYIMPHQDGRDVHRNLSEDPLLRKVPVIMVTALMSNKEIQADDAPKVHGCTMIAKPVRLQKLRQCIEENLATVAVA